MFLNIEFNPNFISSENNPIVMNWGYLENWKSTASL